MPLTPVEDNTPKSGSLTPVEQQSTYIKETGNIINAPSNLNAGQIRYLDNTQNMGEDRKQYFGFDKVFSSTADMVKAPFKGAAASAVSLSMGTLAGNEQIISDAIREGLDTELDDVGFFRRFMSRDPAIVARVSAEKAVRKGDVPRMLGLEAAADRMARSAEKLNSTSDRVVERHFKKPESVAGGVLYDIGGAGTTLATAIGISAVTKNPIAAAGLFAEIQRTDIYQEAREAGLDATDARMKAKIAGLVEGGLEFIGIDRFIRIGKSSTGMKKHFRRMFEEAIQEASQQTGEELITQFGGIREKDLGSALESIGYSAFIGGIAGGGMSAVESQITKKRIKEFAKENDIPESVVKDYINKVNEQSEVLVEQVAEDIEGDANAVRVDNDVDNVAEAMNIINDFAAGNPIDFDRFNENDRAALEAARDEASVIGENQIIRIEREQQQEFIQRAKALKDLVRGAQRVPVPRKPQTLSQFLIERGGLKVGPETQRFTKKNEPKLRGLAKKTGKLELDSAVELAVKHGFIRDFSDEAGGEKKIDIGDLIDALDQERTGVDIIRDEDQQAMDNRIEIELLNSKNEAALFQELSALGFDDVADIQGVSLAELADALRAQEGLDPFKDRKLLKARSIPEMSGKGLRELSEQRREMRETVEPVRVEDMKFLNDQAVAAVQKLRQDDYGFIHGKLLPKADEFRLDMGVGIEKMITPISTRVKNISPLLATRLRRFDFNTLRSTLLDSKKVKPFIMKMGKLDKDVYLALDFAMKNGNEKVITAIATQNDMLDEVQAVREVLDGLFDRAVEADMDVKYRWDFFPRRVNDVDGLMDHLRSMGGAWESVEKAIEKIETEDGINLNDEAKADIARKVLTDRKVGGAVISKDAFKGKSFEEIREVVETNEPWSVVQEAFQRKAEKLERPLSTEERVAVINLLMRGRTVEGVTLAKKGIFKERGIEEINAEIDKYYDKSDKALLSYIAIANEAIETSKLFKVPQNIDGDNKMEDTIGGFIDDLMKSDSSLSSRDARILTEIFEARFNPKRMGWISASARDLSYIDTMGSTLSAITQIGDLATSMYNAGIVGTFRTLPSAMLDKTKIKMEDVGLIDEIANEFDNENLTSGAVDKVFTLTGLRKIDRIGKLTLVNSELSKLQKQAKKEDAELIDQLEFVFQEDAGQVLQDLKDGNITEDIRFMLFSKLADIQPITKSEMPEYYLRSGNLKILYMLKTFTLKQLDLYRREAFSLVYEGTKTGDKKMVLKGMSNFVRLLSFWVVMGASADYIKDLLRSFFGGDEMEEPEDYVMDNVFKALGFSRYQADMLNRSGPVEVLEQLFLPPTKFFDNVWKDFQTMGDDGLTLDNSKSVRSIPLGGELYYFWFGAGQGGNRGRKKRAVNQSISSI